ncbi:Dehydrogenase patE [Sparassis crispa]|uniref:Dehydrogenase patE n=1 Tax=Sparassis crispa TaxID=139825 RepID=A0A401H097_9APHY|nr:Dehydrogenase patE [Sparassis crispa]GBE87857.1 Dehydrogenase patE [Sparassis crispa]
MLSLARVRSVAELLAMLLASVRTRPLKLLGPAAAVSALVLVLRHLCARRAHTQAYTRALAGDPARVARRIQSGDEEYDPEEYDVIVVGGGTAGCVVAARLSEDPSIRVLLIEAGESSRHMVFSQIPSAFASLFHGKHEYNFYTIPQPNAGGKAKYWPRGTLRYSRYRLDANNCSMIAKLLGGCSSLNAMIFHHCAPSDYDEWVRYQKGAEGAEGWSYSEFLPYFIKFENFHPSEKFPLVDPTLRGSGGPVATGYFGNAAVHTMNFIEACDRVGIPRNPDLNTKNALGVSKVSRCLTTIDSNGRRVTTETAYLTRKVLARPNLKVVTKARVLRIVFDVSSETPRAVSVQFLDEQGKRFEAKARKEVVLSAGAIHTPQLLMLSGVGPAAHLAEHGIPVVADLPGVGAHLMDHPTIDLYFRDKTRALEAGMSHTPKGFMKTLGFFRAMLQYQLTRRGPLTTNLAEAVAFIRSSDRSLFLKDEFIPDAELEDTSSAPDAPDIELFSSPMAYTEHGYGQPFDGYTFGLHATLLRPTSTGTIRLSSADPLDPPIIDPNYLSTRHDVALLARAARLLARIAYTEPLAGMLDPTGEAEPAFNHKLLALDDAALEELVRARVETLYHPACTARMAPAADGGVVDPFLRVHGIPNLRVADASVFPTIVAGHTMSPTIAVAEKAADMIKAAFRAQ